MSGPHVRTARAADVPALVPLFADWDHVQPAEVVAERLAVWAEMPYARVLVAEVELAVAGVVAVCAAPHFARPGRFARLVGLAVGQEHRRRGVAPHWSGPPRRSCANGAPTGSRPRPRARAPRHPASMPRSATATTPSVRRATSASCDQASWPAAASSTSGSSYAWVGCRPGTSG